MPALNEEWVDVKHDPFIKAVRYDEPAQVLDIHFYDGYAFRYALIPSKVFSGLLKATSNGFFYKHIFCPVQKGIYCCVTLPTKEAADAS